MVPASHIDPAGLWFWLTDPKANQKPIMPQDGGSRAEKSGVGSEKSGPAVKART
jgi:hypothetical protein